MNKKNKEDMFFRELMSDSLLTVHASGFDDNIIMLIKKRARQKATVSRHKMLARIFFVAGSVFGIIFLMILPTAGEQIPGIQINEITIILQMIFSFVFVFQFYNLLNFKEESHYRLKSPSA